jgi:hypothetical protein
MPDLYELGMLCSGNVNPAEPLFGNVLGHPGHGEHNPPVHHPITPTHGGSNVFDPPLSILTGEPGGPLDPTVPNN